MATRGRCRPPPTPALRLGLAREGRGAQACDGMCWEGRHLLLSSEQPGHLPHAPPAPPPSPAPPLPSIISDPVNYCAINMLWELLVVAEGREPLNLNLFSGDEWGVVAGAARGLPCLPLALGLLRRTLGPGPCTARGRELAVSGGRVRAARPACPAQTQGPGGAGGRVHSRWGAGWVAGESRAARGSPRGAGPRPRRAPSAGHAGSGRVQRHGGREGAGCPAWAGAEAPGGPRASGRVAGLVPRLGRTGPRHADAGAGAAWVDRSRRALGPRTRRPSRCRGSRCCDGTWCPGPCCRHGLLPPAWLQA